MRATRALIHLDNLRHNIREVKRHIGSSIQMCMAVKADGYGHGAVEIARTAVEAGVEWLGVATLDEGIEIKNAGIPAPVLMLSLPLPEEAEAIAACGLSTVAGDIQLLKLLEAAGKKQGSPVQVHLKVDCGMGRIGCRPSEAPELARYIQESGHISLEGICTHFPLSDKKEKGATEYHYSLFEQVIENIKTAGIDPGILHAANSGAIVDMKASYLSMVRPGIILYGYYPSSEQERVIDVKPVMELESRIVYLKEVPEGTGISYGHTYTTPGKRVIGTVPAGYGDGYSRILSNKAKVLIKGRLYPVAGTVCMDQFMVDLGSETDVMLYDRVVLFGPDSAGPSAETLAELMGTISYEITCRIDKRVPRIYLKNESPADE